MTNTTAPMNSCLQQLKPFWYPVLPTEGWNGEPVTVHLLGQKLVLWQRKDGKLGALDDRCRHRSASLSNGQLGLDGNLHCPYHGWAFDTDGYCQGIPQQPEKTIPKRCHTKAYQAKEEHGLAWVCLENQPKLSIPSLSMIPADCNRRILGFHEQWQCSAFRVIENGLDNFHHYFVHRGVLDALSPVPEPMEGEIANTSDGFKFSIPLDLSTTEALEATIRNCSSTPRVERYVQWVAPLGLTLQLAWPNGSKQCIVLFAVPRDSSSCTILRFYLRNDLNEEVSDASVIAFERALIDQDRRILEAMPSDLDPCPTGEQLIDADQPIARMRQLLQKFLATTS